MDSFHLHCADTSGVLSGNFPRSGDVTDASTRLTWIRLYEETGNLAETCRRLGISRPTLRKWLRRYRAEGEDGMRERSHAPLAPRRRTLPTEIESRVLDVRQQHQIGMRRLRAVLHDEHGINLSLDTLRDVLRRHAIPPLAPGRRCTSTGREQPAEPVAERLPRRLPLLPKDDRLAATLADAIASGHLRPGRKLGEEALCKALACGRGRVREALRHLAYAGLVTIIPNRGAYVATPSPETIADAYAARCLLEGEIVADVARHRPASALGTLRRHLALQEAAMVGGRSDLVRLLTEFHLLIAALGSNRILEAMLAGLVAQTSVAVLLHDTASTPSSAIEDHAAILRMISLGDAAEAATLMRKHLLRNKARLCLG